MSSSASHKKDLQIEDIHIRGFTLLFSDSNIESKWNHESLPRQAAMTTRYMFASALFQGLFYISDIVEVNNQWHFPLGLVRLLLGILPLIICFFVKTGLLIPGQLLIMVMNLLYGLPTLAIFYLGRSEASHWDSLYLVYGLCFYMLPKISPLNFLYSFTGASILSVFFIAISWFRLGLGPWMLSNTFLLSLFSLFCYIAYSSERIARERWLLRQRLQREKINLRIVASTIQDDLRKAAKEEQLFPMNNNNNSLKIFSSVGASAHVHTVSSKDSSDSSGINTDRGKKITLFLKGIAAWGLCYGMGYTFDLTSQVSVASSMSPTSELNSSAAFALLMHSMGFSVFLLYFTGQIRWLALNGVVGLAILWLFKYSNMDNKWVVFSTHSVGYILLAVVIVVMILVFGGVVLVWSHLIEFLKDVLIRYPQVKSELSENKLLEQVLIRYISDIPKVTWDSSSGPCVLEVYKDEGGSNHDMEMNKNSIIASSRTHKHKGAAKAKPAKLEETSELGMYHNCKILENKIAQNTCYFCHNKNAEVLLPACSGWVHGDDERHKKGVAMCTPYTEMVTVRDRVLCDNSVLKQQNQQLTNELYVVQAASITASSTSSQLQSKVASLESEMVRLRHEYESKVTQERKRREDDIQSLIIQHNSQLAELKKLYKGIKNAGVKRPEVTSKENNLTNQNPNGHIKPTKQVPSVKPTTSKPSGDSKLARSKTTTQLKETDATTITPSTSDESLRFSSDESLGFASDELLKSPDEKARNATNDAVLNVEEQPRELGCFDIERKTDNFTNIAFCSIDQYDETAMRMEKLIEEILNSEIVYPVETDKKERMKYTNFSF